MTSPIRFFSALFLFCMQAAILSVASGNEGILDTKALANELERTRLNEDMPGLRAAVRYPDGTLVQTAVGMANEDTGQWLDTGIGMPGGSTGKTFTAALALLLVQDGKLSLDDPASKWLGDTDWFSQLPNAQSMLVRHLLTHSSGMNDYIKSMGFHTRMVMRVLRHGSAYFTPEELISYTLDKKPLFPAGQGYAYTDAGYLVLGRIIEKAGGKPYFEQLQERILTPQGLEQVRPQTESAMSNVAMGHMGGSPSLKKDGRMKFDPRSEWTGGGLITNPEMLVRFYAGLVEGRVLQPDLLATMINSGWRDPESPGWHYGMGLFVNETKQILLHGGLWPGYRTRVMHFMDTGITIAVQTNRDGELGLNELGLRIHELSQATDHDADTDLNN